MSVKICSCVKPMPMGDGRCCRCGFDVDAPYSPPVGTVAEAGTVHVSNHYDADGDVDDASLACDIVSQPKKPRFSFKEMYEVVSPCLKGLPVVMESLPQPPPPITVVWGPSPIEEFRRLYEAEEAIRDYILRSLFVPKDLLK